MQKSSQRLARGTFPHRPGDFPSGYVEILQRIELTDLVWVD
jgi:hypothetical protein